MNVPLIAQLGLRGREACLGAISLDVASVGHASSWAGSYHVLQMGRHYDHYVVTGYTAALPALTGLPATHPFEKLTSKIRAAGVTGNVGECVAALFARRTMGAAVADIALIRSRQPFRRRKAPDYLMRLGPSMPGPLAPVLPAGVQCAWPEWWPVESKARSTESFARAARSQGLAQLATYWSLTASSRPSEVGYGLVVSFTYQPPREVRVQIFLPRDRAGLQAQLLRSNSSTARARGLRAFLYDC